MLTPESRRRDFSTLEGRAYLNTAAEGVPPPAVGEALAQYFRDKQLGMDGRVPHAAQWEAARALTAEFFGLTAAEIGICSCSSEAYNLAALALQLQPGDEVVCTDLDFPASSTPWLQPACPATLRLWKHRAGALRVEDLIPLLNPRTRLVNVSLVSFYNGFTVALPPIVEAVRKHSPALLGVDVTQALGRIPLDLRGADLIVSSTHKWILASHGGGLVGVPKDRAKEWTAPAGGWFNLEDAFGPGSFEAVKSKPGAASFMVGMPNYPALYAVRAGLEYLRGVGVANIDAHARPLVRHCLAELRKLPVEVLTPDEPDHIAGILAFKHPKAAEINARLHAGNVHVMNPAGRLRVAVHGYNTHDDIERLLRELKAALAVV
ncbi:aminotransferase class V-fold PLP-dependent enzyme [Gemmata sp. JC717]|uniref:aminotransferase class V-fold PLP-dependent enzyme n=1 Tax=Gemmata algarum TaxID=2975278 RepID=UPI0021BADB0C|nr:aminotransferase class V-fold PLP-dependent enzyme [Gemmata algarum]MDY3556825.1 aminotransferase class V-fold PLP-dependent enzyme [Gemmata algarum]